MMWGKVERLAGVAASLMFEKQDEIFRRWPELTLSGVQQPNFEVSEPQIMEAQPSKSWFHCLMGR